MTRIPIALPIGDLSTFAKSLRKQIQTHDGPPTHVLLTVDIAGSSYLVDVGFGGQTPTAPLRLRADVEQA
ncbi:MAG: arylamine N-acetyltransferase, partial [Alphaproteobacteria bacterium]|nr:arylamine N-acetyltransferase [Alphaproteobacteria bacterium]